MNGDMVTGAEFGRWRTDFASFQDRLETRLADGFTGVHNRLDELNGRTRKNTEGLAALSVQAARIEPIEAHVVEIQECGCAMFHAHQSAMTPAEITEENRPKWPKRRQVIVGGGLVTGGALLWPAIIELAKLGHSIVLWMTTK